MQKEDRLSKFLKEIYICKIGENIIKNSYNQLFKGMKYVTILIFLVTNFPVRKNNIYLHLQVIWIYRHNITSEESYANDSVL